MEEVALISFVTLPRNSPRQYFRKHWYFTFLSLPYISSIVFLVTEEELGVIHLRYSFPSKMKVLSKLLQWSLNFSIFSAQYTVSQLFD
jgi:hypothetical protein